MDPLFEELTTSSTIMAELLKSHYLLFVVQRMLNYLSKQKADILVSMLSRGVNKLKDKKVSISRWSSFLEKYCSNRSSNIGNLTINSKDNPSILGHESSSYLKQNFSPELAPSNILSPPLNPYMFSNVSHPFSPNLVSNPYRNINLVNHPSMIKPGLVNPLNRFRPNQPSNSLNQPQNVVQGQMQSPNYVVINSYNNKYNEVIPNQSYSGFNNSPPQYYMAHHQVPYINYHQSDQGKVSSPKDLKSSYSNQYQAQHCLSPYISKLDKK